MTTARSARPWPSWALGVLCVAAIVAAVLVVGPASGSQTSAGRTITVSQGIVQSTVSGSGNIQAATQLDLGFKTSGVVTQIYVTQGAHVTAGRLLAELNPTSAEVTLEQAKAALQAATANLVQEEETDGESSASSGSAGASSGTSRATASAASVAAHTMPSSPTTPTTHTPASLTTPTTHTPASQTTPTTHTAPAAHTTTAAGESSGTTAPKATINPALRAANVASARAAVRSDRLTVQSDEEALADTRLFAPESGTIVSLSGEVGEAVSASGTTRSSAGTGSSGGSGSGSSGAAALGSGSAAGVSGAGSTGSSGSGSGLGSGSSSSSFAVLSDLSSMQLVVPLSESEVVNVRDNQPATVTIEALEGLKLAAHVLSVAMLPSSTSGVVSYDVTFQLDQLAGGLKPGMSATAEVVVKQAAGVNVPTSAISGGTVTVVHDGKQTRQRVVTGLAGNSSTIILSGLRAGEQILLPIARTSSASLTSRLGGRVGALGGAGGFGGGGGGGGAAFFGGGFRGG